MAILELTASPVELLRIGQKERSPLKENEDPCRGIPVGLYFKLNEAVAAIAKEHGLELVDDVAKAEPFSTRLGYTAQFEDRRKT